MQDAVGAPVGLPDRLGRPACDVAGCGDRAIRGELPGPQLGPVPGHPRVVPLEPRDARAVRARARVGHEVRAAAQQALLAAAQVHGGEHVAYFVRGVALADADQVRAVRAGAPVGEADRRRVVGLRRERLGLAPRTVGSEPDPPQALVGEVRERDAAVDEGPGAAAVLVHAGPGVEVGPDQVPVGSVLGPMHQRGAPALGRPHLGPDDAAPELVGNELRPRDRDVSRGDPRRGQR